jgi:hypothetical protein
MALYKTRNVKIELSNSAAHSLIGINLSEWLTKAFLDCDAAHLRTFQLVHQDSTK